MLPVALLLLLTWQSPPLPQMGYVCGDRDARTEPRRSDGGFIAYLSMHSEDDHGKNSHECQADYSLHVIRPDGTRIDGPPAFGASGFFSSDGEWNRPLVFRIDGFSADGRHVFIFIEEGGQDPSIYADEFDMTNGSRVREEGVDHIFLDRLGAACTASLHISGTTFNGNIVLQIDPSNGCSRTESWELSGYKRIKGSLGSRPGTPQHVAPGAHMTAIVPGNPAPPATRTTKD